MRPDCFLDANVLFYAALGRFSATQKYRRAREIIMQIRFAVSGQGLQGFYVVINPFKPN